MMTQKEKMIQNQLRARDITDSRVLRAMNEVERAVFVPDEVKDQAYRDSPLQIGKGQTIKNWPEAFRPGEQYLAKTYLVGKNRQKSIQGRKNFARALRTHDR